MSRQDDITQLADVACSRLDANVQEQGRVWDIAAAGLVTASFVGSKSSGQDDMIASIHHGFWFLGAVTIISASIFAVLRRNDGESVGGHRDTPAIAQPPSSSHAGTAN